FKSLFSPDRCVGACGSMKQQLLPRWTHSRPFRVITSDRTMKKGIMAENLQDLRNKVMDIFQILCVSTLVLDEDGTGIDTEDFFQTLKDNTVLMVLENGQKWTPPKSHANAARSPGLSQFSSKFSPGLMQLKLQSRASASPQVPISSQCIPTSSGPKPMQPYKFVPSQCSPELHKIQYKANPAPEVPILS
ncbi:hypothetical protein DNTS_004724, partial [Danionella cerebrum]